MTVEYITSKKELQDILIKYEANTKISPSICFLFLNKSNQEIKAFITLYNSNYQVYVTNKTLKTKKKIILDIKPGTLYTYFHNVFGGYSKKVIRTTEDIKKVYSSKLKKTNILVLTIGAPGSGKSTWIQQQGLENYTLSSDKIRLSISEPIINDNGDMSITQFHDNEVWKILYNLLESRLKKGLFTVIDATHTKTNYLSYYVNICEKYGYTIYYKFFNTSLDDCIRNNEGREGIYKVPNQVIVEQYLRLQQLHIPKKWVRINDKNDLPNSVSYPISTYDTIYYIGDIQGCSKELKQFLDTYYDDKSLFVFTGDLLDRGYDNKGVLEQVFTIMNNNNVIFIEGNHEGNLYDWLYGNPITSEEFLNNTLPQIKDIDKDKLVTLMNKLQFFHSITLGKQRILSCHGGVNNPNISFISKHLGIRGTGNYDLHHQQDMIFEKNSLQIDDGYTYYSVHGHRNTLCDDVSVNSRVFNLEGKVEFGGDLRIVKFSLNEKPLVITIPSYVTKTNEKTYKPSKISIKNYRNDPCITINTLNHNLISFIYTPIVFNPYVFDNYGLKISNLVVNNKGIIVMRGYPLTNFQQLNDDFNTYIYVTLFDNSLYIMYNGKLIDTNSGLYNDIISSRDFKNLPKRLLSTSTAIFTKDYILQDCILNTLEFVNVTP